MASKRKKRPDPVQVIEPTPEQLAKGEFGRQVQPGQQAAPYRRIPVIDTMSQTGKLTKRQFDGLARYREVAIAEERSPMRDSLDKALEGRGGNTDGTGYIRTAQELVRLENALGSLRDIARAVAVDDITVSRWALAKGGSAKSKDGIVTIEPRRKALGIAMIEIKMAGERLAAAIGY